MSYYQNLYVVKRNSKKQAQTIHAKKRGVERMGIAVKASDLARMVRLIQTGRSLWSQKRTNRIIWHKLELDGTIFNVAYDKARKQIASILPPEDF